MAALRVFESWAEVGQRVADARASAGLTQEQLSATVGLERSALSKVEKGRRELDSLELARIAHALGKPIEWFISRPAPAVVSRRAEGVEQAKDLSADQVLESLSRDVELLVEIEALRVPDIDRPKGQMDGVESAERFAREARIGVHEPSGPLLNLDRYAERLGLYAFSWVLDENAPDGLYAALDDAGVAVINGSMEPGRRRFTLAHEIGHHFLQDEYSTDWAVGLDSRSGRERLINAFAVHFLMPRESVSVRWKELRGSDDARSTAIVLASEYRVSWTAAISHLCNLGLVDPSERAGLERASPTRADYLERGLPRLEELVAPSIPPAFAAAVLKAHRSQKIAPERAIELLRGIVSLDELPPVNEVPLEALRGELTPLE